jgi:hypothetical protein
MSCNDYESVKYPRNRVSCGFVHSVNNFFESRHFITFSHFKA